MTWVVRFQQPCRLMSMNDRSGWRARNRATRAWRRAAFVATLEQLGGMSSNDALGLAWRLYEAAAMTDHPHHLVLTSCASTRSPVGRDIARRFIAEHHRHNLPPLGAVFYLGVADETGTLRGVASVGRPVARHADDGFTLEITRVCTDGASGAPSFLYAAAVRVGRELGYRRAITYTLSTEPGTSLRAAGFTPEAELPPRPTWDTPTRPRVQLDLFGQERRPPASKIRWARSLRRGRPTL